MGKKPAAKKHIAISEHLLSFDEIQTKLETSFDPKKPSESKGLSVDLQKTRILEFGKNMLSPPKRIHPFVKYLLCLAQLFNILLILCAILTWILYAIAPIENAPNSYIGAVLFAVALLNALIEFYQHQKSAALLGSFLVFPSNQGYDSC